MTTESLRPDALVLHYRLLAEVRPGARDIWRAEDTRNGRTVFLKVLSRSLPKEKGRRDALLSKLRQNGAFVHAAYPLVWEISADEDLLFISTEWVDGEPLSKRVARALPTAEEFLKWAWQLTEALSVMHKRELVHANFSGENIVIDPAGNLRLFGLGLPALSDRRERGDLMLLGQSPSVDLDALAFKSPEEADGKAIEPRSDIFSIGSILYLLATGKAPFGGTNVAEVTTAVTKLNPRNPMELNPQLQPKLLQLIGKCVFKNSVQRYANADALLADIEKIEPRIRTIAAYPKVFRAEAPVTRTMANLLMAELPYYDLLSAKEPERAVRLSAKMQQVVGEAVYLFDGEIIDSIGSRLLAIVPDARNTIGAAQRALAELAESNGGSDAIEPRMALHRGEIARKEMSIEGSAVSLLGQVVASLEPLQVLVSEPLLRSAGVGDVEMAAEVDGVKFAPLPQATPVEAPLAEVVIEPVDEELPAPAFSLPLPQPAVTPGIAPAASNEVVAPPSAARARSSWMKVAAAGIVVVTAAGVGAMLLTRGGNDAPATIAQPAPKPAPAPPSKLFIAAIALPADASGASANLAPALVELLRQSGKIEVTTTPDPAAMQLTVRPGAAAGEIVPQLSGKGEGPAMQTADPGAATAQLLAWAGAALKVPTSSLVSAQPAAMASFARAAAQFRSGDAAARGAAAEAIVDAIAKDPAYVPAYRLAMEIHSASGDRKQLVATATQLVALQPDDLATRRQLLTWHLEAGQGAEALAQVGPLLEANPNDVVALQTVARLALSAGDAAKFGKAVERLEKIARPADKAYIHRPDIFATAGDFDRAAQMYYDIESREPENAALALKIGRIAAMRESWEVADIELKKLQRLSPDYGARVLQAYIAAQKKDAAAVEAHLTAAAANASWHEDTYTHAAEVYALMSQKEKVVVALEKAHQRGEANIMTVLLKQPFFYIGYDARSSKLRSEMESRRSALRAALGALIL